MKAPQRGVFLWLKEIPSIDLASASDHFMRANNKATRALTGLKPFESGTKASEIEITRPKAHLVERTTLTPIAIALCKEAIKPFETVPLPVQATTKPSTPAINKASTTLPLAPTWFKTISTCGHDSVSGKVSAFLMRALLGFALKDQRTRPSSIQAKGPASPELKASSR
jgi:hypothetical protein